MNEEFIRSHMENMRDAGLMKEHEGGGFTLTDAGKDYVENVLFNDIENRAQIYALGRLQGLSEGDADEEAP